MQYVNTRLVELSGPNATDLSGSYGYVVSASLIQQLQQGDDAVFERREKSQLVQSVTLASGEVRHFYSVKFPFCDQHGETHLVP